MEEMKTRQEDKDKTFFNDHQYPQRGKRHCVHKTKQLPKIKTKKEPKVQKIN
jgi:hypothetical protein